MRLPRARDCELTGRLDTEVRLECCRCLEPFQHGVVTDFYEWLAAGRVIGNACVTPTAECPVRELHFGRNLESIFIRLDTVALPAAAALTGSMVSVEFPGHPDSTVALPNLQPGRSEVGDSLIVLGKIVEIAIPLALAPDGGDELRFRVVLTSPDGTKQTMPSAGSILLTADVMTNRYKGAWFL